MNRESLEKVQEKVVDILNNVDIDTVDKIELLINLMNFLDPKKYKDNLLILKKMKKTYQKGRSFFNAIFCIVGHLYSN